MYLQGYQKFCYSHWRPPQQRDVSFPRYKGNNSGLLLWGERGCGKSQILTYVTAWAHEQNWIVFTIPECQLFTWGSEELSRHKNGLFLQPELAVSVLKDFRHANEVAVHEFDVDMNIYGTCDYTGVRDGDPEPCPRVWDPRRQT
eukprot:CAMPEP_0202967672 /NCGR_PEP_ID=MMETSP1396-20130829/12653_1 /ASSEMBLY_ACC=CAM_ASM_000872 /TAXON_ID= /ORGANISM="Pseudokeronopsis sp., Strain Brazil" /LENGTH=143 /DNA_ID=CAMNT_0049693025 /DNA_START=54 /DNA_END=481 /DNA_ORIENTATION=+